MPEDQRLSIRLSIELLHKIQAMAKTLGTTPPELMRAMIQQATLDQLRACPHNPPHRYPFGCPD